MGVSLKTRIVFIALGLLFLLVGLYVIKNNNQTGLDISGVVVPHHDLVAQKRAQFFSELAGRIKQPKTIILVSPNHYSAGQGNIQTTTQDWNLGKGKIFSDKNLTSFLLEQKLATNEPTSFIDEHGIYNILEDIHNNFPKAALVPIILKQVSQEKLSSLERGLNQFCSDCLMIASVDFSHYQPAILAELHDERSIRDLQSLNTKDILTGSEVDSGPSLALLTMWAKDHNTLNFNLNTHTNSGIIFQNPDLESTTHVFGWYQKGQAVEPEKSASFIFGGDMMFARGVEQTFGNDFNSAFSQFGDRVFWGTDGSVINLEGAITENPVKIPANSRSMIFQFKSSIIKTLSFLHINVAGQANNHSDNAGEEGLDLTRSLLNKAGIQSFGGPAGADVSYSAKINGNGINAVILGINLAEANQDATILVPLILQAKKDASMRVIVMPHWGTEYLALHTIEQEKAARLWIDAGADMVIGSHPHVIEDAEVYKNVPIIYSVGNLLFDQSFSRKTQEGLLIAGKFTQSGLAFFALPVESVNGRPQLIRGKRKQEILSRLYSPFKDYLQETSAGSMITIEK